MGIPTRAELYTQLTEYLIKAQEASAMLAHLHQTEDTRIDKTLALGWLGVSELMRKMQHQVTQMMMGRLN